MIPIKDNSIWPIDRTQLGATTPGQNGPRSNDNQGVLHIPQKSSITETSPSDCFVSYPGNLLWGCLTPLQRRSRFILYSQPIGLGFCGCRWFRSMCKVNQKFCNILLMCDSIRQLQIIFPRSWRWRTTLCCEITNSPDTFQVLLTSMVWSTVSEYTVLGLSDMAWLSTF